MNELEQITFITHTARATMLNYLSRETCIMSTRMVSLMLERILGLRCLPVAVSAVAINYRGAHLLENGKTMKDLAEDENTAMLICRHKGPQADKPGDWWGGHLTMVVAGRYFVDASADQFTFANGGIVVSAPIVHDLGDEAAAFLNDEMQLGFNLSNGALLAYESELEDLTYRDSHDWEANGPGDKLYEYVATRVEGLFDIFASAEDFSQVPLPELPNAPWKRNLTQEEMEARDLIVVTELGYTPAELIEMSKREAEREVKRSEKHGMVRMTATKEDDYMLTPTLRRALAERARGAAPRARSMKT